MPDQGGSMADAEPRKPGEEQLRSGVQRRSHDEEQDERMPEYEIEQRKKESSSVIERSGGQGADDGTDQVFGAQEERER
jgi:hypothetical protein